MFIKAAPHIILNFSWALLLFVHGKKHITSVILSVLLVQSTITSTGDWIYDILERDSSCRISDRTHHVSELMKVLHVREAQIIMWVKQRELSIIRSHEKRPSQSKDLLMNPIKRISILLCHFLFLPSSFTWADPVSLPTIPFCFPNERLSSYDFTKNPWRTWTCESDVHKYYRETPVAV